MRYRHQTLPLLYILLLGCATLAPYLRTETSPCHHSLPSSVFCFKKSICWNAITPLTGWAFVALSPLFLIVSPLRRSRRVCSPVGLSRCCAISPQAIGLLASVAWALYRAEKRPLPRVSSKP